MRSINDVSAIQVWWDQLPEVDRDRLKEAVRHYPADPSIVGLLLSAGEPMRTSWTSTSIGGQGQAVALHGPLAEFIEDQLADD